MLHQAYIATLCWYLNNRAHPSIRKSRKFLKGEDCCSVILEKFLNYDLFFIFWFDSERSSFSMRNFTSKHQLGQPVAGNFFLAQTHWKCICNHVVDIKQLMIIISNSRILHQVNTFNWPCYVINTSVIACRAIFHKFGSITISSLQRGDM